MAFPSLSFASNARLIGCPTTCSMGITVNVDFAASAETAFSFTVRVSVLPRTLAVMRAVPAVKPGVSVAVYTPERVSCTSPSFGACAERSRFLCASGVNAKDNSMSCASPVNGLPLVSLSTSVTGCCDFPSAAMIGCCSPFNVKSIVPTEAELPVTVTFITA